MSNSKEKVLATALGVAVVATSSAGVNPNTPFLERLKPFQFINFLSI